MSGGAFPRPTLPGRPGALPRAGGFLGVRDGEGRHRRTPVLRGARLRRSGTVLFDPQVPVLALGGPGLFRQRAGVLPGGLLGAAQGDGDHERGAVRRGLRRGDGDDRGEGLRLPLYGARGVLGGSCRPRHRTCRSRAPP
ncbi:hypothetical protein [Streptomyces enissocaesilis]|uniref:Uncharacterized protein n=1 Tax=Streptomyces enissocaesilis TaxID=332589 RepID=A0ABN3XMK2_9ACTN